APGLAPSPLRPRTESEAAGPGGALAAALGAAGLDALSSEGTPPPLAPTATDPTATDPTATAADVPLPTPARPDDPAGPDGPETPALLPPLTPAPPSAGDGPAEARSEGLSRIAAALAGYPAEGGPRPGPGQPDLPPGDPVGPPIAPSRTEVAPPAAAATDTALSTPSAARPLPSLVEAEPPPPVTVPTVPSPAEPPGTASATLAVPRIRMESGAVPESVAVPSPPAPVTVPPPPQPVGGVRVQSAPGQAASVVPPERGLEQERAWVRRTFSSRYNAIAGTVSRVMSESPGLRGASRSDAADALTDLVAVRLYLSGDSAAVDETIRAAAAGPHVPLARCVTAGLRRLPSYRGPVLLRTRLSATERAWYADGRTAVEWAFCTGWTAPPPAPADGTDFLIWSMTARRTALLDPHAPDRVLFLPGTAFKVLRTDESGDRPVVLLRELSPAEAAADPDAGTAVLADPAARRLPLDEIALDSLERSVTALGLESRSEQEETPGVLGNPPGLLIARDRLRPAADRGQAPEGAAP
ncbi:hypothetical protein ACEZDB_32765, partial [Streptacidiphilus sp. N1-3]